MHLLDLLHQTEYEPGHWWKKQTDVGKQGKCMRGITKYSYFLLFKKNVLCTTFSCYGLHIIKTPREKKKKSSGASKLMCASMCINSKALSSKC